MLAGGGFTNELTVQYTSCSDMTTQNITATTCQDHDVKMAPYIVEGGAENVSPKQGGLSFPTGEDPKDLLTTMTVLAKESPSVADDFAAASAWAWEISGERLRAADGTSAASPEKAMAPMA